MRIGFIIAWVFLTLSISSFAHAQTGLTFTGLDVQEDAPIEATSSRLTVDQETGNAVFIGDVVVGQGTLRLTADQVTVIYSEEGGIQTMLARGDVTIVTSTEAAEADAADYRLSDRELFLSGNVLVTQGQNAISSDRLTVDLDTNGAIAEGNVKSILQSGGN